MIHVTSITGHPANIAFGDIPVPASMTITLRTGRKTWTFDTDMDIGTLMREVAAFAPKSRPVTTLKFANLVSGRKLLDSLERKGSVKE